VLVTAVLGLVSKYGAGAAPSGTGHG
jgi:hypothetical protein